MAEQPIQRFYWPESAIDWPEPASLCDIREDTNFKGSDLSCPSIYFLFYAKTAAILNY